MRSAHWIPLLALLPACDLVFPIAPLPDGELRVDGDESDGPNNPVDAPPMSMDLDGDGFPDVDDLCPLTFSEDNQDTDGDQIGNACDPDPENMAIKQKRNIVYLATEQTGWEAILPQEAGAWVFSSAGLEQQDTQLVPRLDGYTETIHPPATIAAMFQMTSVARGTTPGVSRAGIFLVTSTHSDTTKLPPGFGCGEQRHTGGEPPNPPDEELMVAIDADGMESTQANPFLAGSPGTADRFAKLTISIGAAYSTVTCTSRRGSEEHAALQLLEPTAISNIGAWTDSATAQFRVLDIIFTPTSLL